MCFNPVSTYDCRKWIVIDHWSLIILKYPTCHVHRSQFVYTISPPQLALPIPTLLDHVQEDGEWGNVHPWKGHADEEQPSNSSYYLEFAGYYKPMINHLYSSLLHDGNVLGRGDNLSSTHTSESPVPTNQSLRYVVGVITSLARIWWISSPSFMYSYIHSSIHSFKYSFIYSFIQVFIHSYRHILFRSTITITSHLANRSAFVHMKIVIAG